VSGTARPAADLSAFDLHPLAEGRHYRSYERPGADRLVLRHDAGVWEGFVPGVAAGALYRYRIDPQHGPATERADPYGFAAEIRPQTIGAPRGGVWREVLNSDAAAYGGSGGNGGAVSAVGRPQHGRPFRLDLVVPPLAVVVFQPAAGGAS